MRSIGTLCATLVHRGRAGCASKIHKNCWILREMQRTCLFLPFMHPAMREAKGYNCSFPLFSRLPRSHLGIFLSHPSLVFVIPAVLPVGSEGSHEGEH